MIKVFQKLHKSLKKDGIQSTIRKVKQNLERNKKQKELDNSVLADSFFKSYRIGIITEDASAVEKLGLRNLSESLNQLGFWVVEDSSNNQFPDDCVAVISNCKLYSKNQIILSNKLEYNKCINTIQRLRFDLQNRSWIMNNLTVIVLNYNNSKTIQKSLDSLLKYQDEYQYKVIVVDNGSTDGSYEMLEHHYRDKIQLIKNTKNGCSSGRNLGINATSTEYVLFLDSDQWPTNSYWLEPYIEIIEKHKNKDSIGAIGWTGGWLTKKGESLITADDFVLRSLKKAYLYRTDLDYLGTGGMLVKKDLLIEVDCFDEFYDPTGFEDTDLSMKLKTIGKDLIYCPYLSIYHEAHQTTLGGRIDFESIIMRNEAYFKEKWYAKNGKF